MTNKNKKTKECQFFSFYLIHKIFVSFVQETDDIKQKFLNEMNNTVDLMDIINVKRKLFKEIIGYNSLKQAFEFEQEKEISAKINILENIIGTETIKYLEEFDIIFEENKSCLIDFFHENSFFMNINQNINNIETVYDKSQELHNKYNITDIQFQEGILTDEKLEILYQIEEYLIHLSNFTKIEPCNMGGFSLFFCTDGFYNNFYNKRTQEIYLNKNTFYAFIHEWLHHIDYTIGQNIKKSLFKKRISVEFTGYLSNVKTIDQELIEQHPKSDIAKEEKNIIESMNLINEKIKHMSYQNVNIEDKDYINSDEEKAIFLFEAWIFFYIYQHKINFLHINSNFYPNKQEIISIDSELFEIWKLFLPFIHSD